MGPINWLAVILSAAIAIGLGPIWYGRWFGAPDRTGRIEIRRFFGCGVLQALSSLMLGHNFARAGVGILAAKPWLYWMQSGGLAIGFIIPALWISYAHRRIARRDALVDGGYWLVVYLAAGTVFWALR